MSHGKITTGATAKALCLSQAIVPQPGATDHQMSPYLPREFTSVSCGLHFTTHLHCSVSELHDALISYQDNQEHAALNVAGDFNSANH